MNNVSEKMFPVQLENYKRGFVPWELVAPHEAQAMQNHGGQTLKRLAERSGLSKLELWAVMHDVRFPWLSSDYHPTDEELDAWFAEIEVKTGEKN